MVVFPETMISRVRESKWTPKRIDRMMTPIIDKRANMKLAMTKLERRYHFEEYDSDGDSIFL